MGTTDTNPWRPYNSSAPDGLPHDDTGPHMLAVTFTTWGLAALFVIARLYTRGRIARVIGWTDWFILLSLLAALAMCVCMVIGQFTPSAMVTLTTSNAVATEIRLGMGKHIYDVDPANMSGLAQGFWFSLLFYILCLGFSKISICLLYLTIFTLEWARRLSYGVLAIVVVHLVWVLISCFTFCVPLESIWNYDIQSTFCQPQNTWWANTGMAILTDILIFCIPMPFVGPLKLPRRQKIVVVGIFAMGFFICIVSLIRLVILVKAQLNPDPDTTYNNTNLNHWTSIEAHTAIIVACAMTLKPLVTKFFPNLLVPQTPDSSGSPSNASSGPQLTIGSKPLRKQPSPAGGGAYMEVAEGGNETNDVALGDIEAQSHETALSKSKDITAVIESEETEKDNDDSIAELRTVKRPFARSDAGSVRTEDLGPPATARSMG
ncbi:hypothetical protein QBC35DRAFT_383311 [Podospora australis]|uniref:Rhodopsin domain-containing protein n=1 Tax=Podospora australis TaxID=1536484 RepID=A0AAN6WV80_9PEZI|nr:hypothetical protein QBC35DRAFT_383311 [Podospora australis]